MILYIDTTDFNNVTYALSDSGKIKSSRTVLAPRLTRLASKAVRSTSLIKKQTYKIDPHSSSEILAKLEQFLNKSQITNPKSQIQRIITNKGPGSYTGTRIGVTHAQALGFALGIPVKFVAKEKFSIK